MIERLHHLDAHTSIFLLRNCLWLPKLQYLLRAAPLYRHAGLLGQLDAVMKSAVISLSNVMLKEDSWEQATLPTRYGGLGLRLLVDVALPSYVSSLHSCHQIISTCLPASLITSATEERDKAAADWRDMAGGSDIPDGDEQHKQRAWDAVLAERNHRRLLSEFNQFARARLLSAAAPESAAWLHAIPAATLGTLLDQETLRVAIALRVGADVCSSHRCRCGSMADRKGYHALTCRFSAGRHPRHTALNDVVRRALQSAGIPSLLEPTGVDRGDGKRPDGMTIYPFAEGKCLTWDATCVNTFAESHVLSAAISAGAAARDAEEKKRKKYADLARRFHFEPLAFETSGVAGPSTRTFVRELGKRMTSVSGDRRETAWLWQRLGLAIVRGNAASVLQTTDSVHLTKALPNPASNAHAFKGVPSSPPTKPLATLLVSSAQTDLSSQSRSESPAGELSVPLPLSPASKVAVPSGTTDQRRRGLINLGSTCYMNAVLQTLFHSDQLCSGVLASRPSPSRPHLAALQRVFAFLAFSERSVYSPAEFQRDALPPWFERGRQHDCSEFLSYLLDAMHEEERVPTSPAAPPVSVAAAVSLSAQSDDSSREPRTGDSSDDGTVDGRTDELLRKPSEPAAGLVRRLLTGHTETTYECCACGSMSRHVDRVTDLHLALPEALYGAEPDSQASVPAAPQCETEPAVPQFDPKSSHQVGLEPAPLLGPVSDHEGTLNIQPETNITVAVLLKLHLAPERLCEENRYYCTTCAGLRDADRQVRLLMPPQHLVVSLGRFEFDQQTGARRKVLAPVGLTELLDVPVADRQPAQYRLYAVIVHSGHSLDAGHYYSFCRASDGGDGVGSDGAEGGWWRLDDATAAPVSAAVVLGRPQRTTDAAYTLMYRLVGAAAGVRPPVLAALPGPLRAAVNRDNAVYRQMRQRRPSEPARRP